MTVIVIGLIFGGVAFVLWRAAHSVLTGGMTPGDLIQFVFLSVMAASGVGALGEVWGDVQKAAGAMQRRLIGIVPADRRQRPADKGDGREIKPEPHLAQRIGQIDI